MKEHVSPSDLPAQAPVDAGPGDGPIPTAGAVNRDTARRVKVEEIILENTMFVQFASVQCSMLD